MVRIITKLFLTTFLVSAVGLNAHIFMIEKWTNGSQDIYCLSDYHRSTEQRNKVCNIQRMDIVDAAKKHNAFVITEDNISHPSCQIAANPLEYDQNRDFTNELDKSFFTLHGLPLDVAPILGLTSYCHYAKIPVYNADFRLAKATSFHDNSIDSGTALSKSGIIRKEISNYDDGQLLNAYYQKKIDEYITDIVNPCTDFFNQLSTYQCSLKNALPLIPYDQQLNRIKLDLDVDIQFMNQEEKKRAIVRFYDSQLLDLRIIHSIYVHKKHPTILLCAGYAHIERVTPALKLMGFKPVDCYCHTNNNLPEPRAIDIAAYFASEKPKNGVRHG